MREIKFRAWDKEINIMHSWRSTKDLWDLSVFEDAHKDIVLMQYTGLKDGNGKEIYEGDILKYVEIEMEDGYLIEGFSGYVEWISPAFVFKSGKNGEYTDPLDHTDECEVIGNIYENPELLG